MTVKEAAIRLGMTETRVVRLAKIGRIAGVRSDIGRKQWTLDAVSVNSYVARDVGRPKTSVIVTS